MIFFVFLILCNSAYAELKIGFVKVDQILKEAPQASISNKKLETEFKVRTEKLKKDIELKNKEVKKLEGDK